MAVCWTKRLSRRPWNWPWWSLRGRRWPPGSS